MPLRGLRRRRARRCRAWRAGARPAAQRSGGHHHHRQLRLDGVAHACCRARCCRRSGCSSLCSGPPKRRPRPAARMTMVGRNLILACRVTGAARAHPPCTREWARAPRMQKVGRSLTAFHVRDAPGLRDTCVTRRGAPALPILPAWTSPTCARATNATSSTRPPRRPTRWSSSSAGCEQALNAQLPEPNAMTLATVGADGRPSTRVVLIKGFDARGIVWYTNYASRKGRELAHQPLRRAAVPLGRTRARGAHRGPRREDRRPPSPTPTTRRARSTRASAPGPRRRAR